MNNTLTINDITSILATQSVKTFYYDLLYEPNDSYSEDYIIALDKGKTPEEASAYADDQRSIYLSELVDTYRSSIESMFADLCFSYDLILHPKFEKKSKLISSLVYEVRPKISWRKSAEKMKLLYDKTFPEIGNLSFSVLLQRKQQTPKEFVLNYLFLVRYHYALYNEEYVLADLS